MTANHEIPFKVFYSWQSDLPDAVNKKLIRTALTKAGIDINSEGNPNLNVVIDEATREVPGSPNIADTIFAKIKEADVFACDLTKVAESPNAKGEIRKYCNPNVAIELGYAVRVLGWNRIIIVFNLGYGEVSNDLPFDARGHRTSTYNCKMDSKENGKPTDACNSEIKNATGSLHQTLKEALKLIASTNPKRPQELETISPKVIERERDVEQIRQVFYWINVIMLDRFIDKLAEGRLLVIGNFLSDGLLKEVNYSSFFLYNKELEELVKAFCEDWMKCFENAGRMDLTRNGAELFLKGDCFTKEQENCYNFIINQNAKLKLSLDALLKYVRNHYLEIDVSKSGIEAVTICNSNIAIDPDE